MKCVDMHLGCLWWHCYFWCRLDICIHIARGDKSAVAGCSSRSQQSQWRQRAWIGLLVIINLFLFYLNFLNKY